MNTRVAVYTALFGKYDKLNDPEIASEKVDYICFTDQQDIRSDVWDIRYINPNNDFDGTSLNRKYKMLPHIYLNEYETSIYVDSNILLSGDVTSLVDKYLSDNVMAMPRHFLRDCIYKEAEECLKIGKIKRFDFNKLHNDLYLKNDFPKSYGLGENNILLRKHNDKKLVEAMEYWWFLFKNFAPRDQLTLMYVLWFYKIDFTFMKESSRNKNIYFGYRLHENFESANSLKKVVFYMSSVRDKNIFYKTIGKLFDVYNYFKFKL